MTVKNHPIKTTVLRYFKGRNFQKTAKFLCFAGIKFRGCTFQVSFASIKFRGRTLPSKFAGIKFAVAPPQVSFTGIKFMISFKNKKAGRVWLYAIQNVADYSAKARLCSFIGELGDF